ncbi:hypothetical protein [Alkaliflexus imshenetskii]|uniref:hypothetical protein n=1 Tax=Alkaliflexus imshenetskii TaxID=286730 RepID=UPI00047D02E4|nr:hypothetical protein [Alkaliflexus imshenetskii]
MELQCRPAFFEKPEPNHTVYAYTWVYANEPMEAGLYAGFQNYSRFENDLPPPHGKWDYNESRIWFNNKEFLWRVIRSHSIFSCF